MLIYSQNKGSQMKLGPLFRLVIAQIKGKINKEKF